MAYQYASSKWLKAKTGQWVIETLARDNDKPKLFRFCRLMPNGKEVELWDVVADKAVLVDADDRYGHYPIINQSKVDEIVSREFDLRREADKYGHILDLIDNYAHADLRI